MAELKYFKGDLFKNLPTDKDVFIAHCCNDIGVMGSGFVVPLAKTFPVAKSTYVQWHKDTYIYQDTFTENGYGTNIPFSLGEVHIVHCKDRIYTANMIGQHLTGFHNGRPPVRYTALISAMNKLKKFISDRKKERFDPIIYCPLFGSKLAGGQWPLVSELVREIWIDNGIDVISFYLEDSDLPDGILPLHEDIV